MTDLRDMTTGEAAAWRAGWEAARSAIKHAVADALPDDADYARVMAAIRAMQPPAPTGKGAGE